MGTKSDRNVQIDLLYKLSGASSLQQIVDGAYELLGNPMFITDMARTVLAYTKTVDIPHPAWQTYVVDSRMDVNAIRRKQVGVVHTIYDASRAPVLVEDDHIPFPRIIKTLRANNRAVGVMVLTAYAQAFGEQDAELMELLSPLVIECLRSDTFRVDTDEKSVENYLIKLLRGAEYKKETVDERFAKLGWKRYARHYILVIWSLADDNGGATLTSILKTLREQPDCCCFLYDGAIVCVHHSKRAITNWHEQAPRLEAVLAELGLVAGVGRSFASVCDLRRSYDQALRAVSMGVRLGRPQVFFPYDLFSIYHLFQQYPAENLIAFCSRRVLELGNYDKTHNSELCVTLQVYLDNARSLSKTADILFVHRNTVRYRIKKCFDMLDSELTGDNEFFTVMFSLRLLEYERKFNTPPASRRPRSDLNRCQTQSEKRPGWLLLSHHAIFARPGQLQPAEAGEFSHGAFQPFTA
ncbi:MAG: helix-turn-helix domain-containing protein [Clostridiales Family XIII bacterium]|jgi:sugar diacid utilization regulator|nr:helix-turn-helix domain-containing protein [Clostridiales Family XIII bacterium]